MSDLGPAPASPPGTPATVPTGVGTPCLQLSAGDLDEMIAHCLGTYPEEGCGLLVGDPTTSVVASVHPTRNLAASAQVYTVDPREHLHLDREAEHAGQAVIGVFHSHTHTDAYPSPTDVAQATDPGWHYVLVSLRDTHPVVRSYLIRDGQITEEPVEVPGLGVPGLEAPG